MKQNNEADGLTVFAMTSKNLSVKTWSTNGSSLDRIGLTIVSLRRKYTSANWNSFINVLEKKNIRLTAELLNGCIYINEILLKVNKGRTSLIFIIPFILVIIESGFLYSDCADLPFLFYQCIYIPEWCSQFGYWMSLGHSL